MSFHAELGFLSASACSEFTTKFLPRLPGCRPAESLPENGAAAAIREETREDSGSTEGAPEDAFPFRLSLTLSSPTAARDLCHQLVGFLHRHRQSGVRLGWTGADMQPQMAVISERNPRDSDVIGMRVSAAVKSHQDAAKMAARTAS